MITERLAISVQSVLQTILKILVMCCKNGDLIGPGFRKRSWEGVMLGQLENQLLPGSIVEVIWLMQSI